MKRRRCDFNKTTIDAADAAADDAVNNNFNLHVLAETASQKRSRRITILDVDAGNYKGNTSAEEAEEFEYPMLMRIDHKTKRIWIHFNAVRQPETKVCVYQIPLDVFEILEESNPVVSVVTTAGFINKALHWKEAVVLRRFGILNNQKKMFKGSSKSQAEAAEDYFMDARILLLSLYDTHQQASDLLNSLAKLKVLDDLAMGWKYKIFTSERYFKHIKNQEIKSQLKNHFLAQRVSWSAWEYRILKFSLMQQKDAGLRAMTWCQFTKIKTLTEKVYTLVEYLAEINRQMNQNDHNKQVIMTRMVYGSYPKPKNSQGSLLGLLWLKNNSCRTLVERVAKELRVLEMSGSRRFSSANRYHRIVLK